MEKTLSIIRKDIRLYFASPVSILFYFVLPIIFTTILAVTTGSFSSSAIKLNYVDQSNSPLSVNLLEELGESGDLKPEAIDLDKARKLFDEGQLDNYLVIPPDFNTDALLHRDLTVYLFQQPNRTSSQTIYQALRLALNKLTSAQVKLTTVLQAYQQSHPEVTSSELEKLGEELNAEIRLKLAEAPSRLTESISQVEDDIVYNPATSSSAGQLITWVFIPLVGLSGAMVHERSRGTLKRLLATPTSRLTYFSATIFGHVLIALVQMSLLMIFGGLVLKAPWLERPLPTFLLLVAFSLVSAGLGAFLGSLVRTEAQANGLSNSIGMIFALLSGAWFPIELFPKVMQNTAKIFPTYWGMKGLKDILISNKPIGQIFPTIGILLLFAIVFLALGTLFFKTE